MYINRVLMFQIDDIIKQYRRNHRIDSKRHREMTDHIEANLAESNNELRASTLREAVSLGMSLSAEVDDIHIERGWQAPRFRFTIELIVEEARRSSPGSRMVITGWTDRCEMQRDGRNSNNVYIAEDTEMYVNNVTVIRDFLREDRRGNEYLESKVFDNYQMILGEYHNARDRSRDNEYVMRPSEIFAMIDRIDDIGDEDDDVTDTRTMFNTGIRANNASNNQRMHYLKTLMNCDVDGRGEHEVYGARHRDNASRTSRDIAAYDVAREREVTWRRNAFFMAILDRNKDFTGSRRFEYRDLVDITEDRRMDTLEEITECTEINDCRASDSARLNGASRELINAFTVCNEIPVIMADSHISAIEFTIDGTTMDSRRRNAEMVIVPESVHYIIDGDFGTDLVDAFENRFIREVFNVITEDGNIPVYIHVSCDIGGMTVIDMEYDGGDMVIRKFATFTNSTAAPVITRNEKSALTFAKNYLAIRRDVVDRALASNSIEVEDEDEDDRDGDRRTAIPRIARIS